MSNPGADNDTQENQRLPEHLENGRKELAELWARASKLALHLLAALELALGVSILSNSPKFKAPKLVKD